MSSWPSHILGVARRDANPVEKMRETADPNSKLAPSDMGIRHQRKIMALGPSRPISNLTLLVL